MMKKKIDKRIKEIAELKAGLPETAATLQAGWQRCLADFDNFKKRTEVDRQNWLKTSKMDSARELLPILDNFDLAILHLSNEQKKDPTVAGIIHIQKQLHDLLTGWGVAKINVNVGDKFDPNFHEAVESVDNKGGEIIAQILQTGYKIGDVILRPTKVVTRIDADQDAD